MQKQYLFEACVGNYNEAKNAEINGAHRIELCENLAQGYNQFCQNKFKGGTTPSYGTIKICKQSLSIPIIVMIRPRAGLFQSMQYTLGNFTYQKEELQIIYSDIEICKQLKVQGIAIGIITTENKIDLEEMKKIIEFAFPLEIVFHMAFDQVHDETIAIQQLIDLKIKRILTRGQIEGNEWNEKRYNNIKRMIEIAENKVELIVGGNSDCLQYFLGGVTSENWQIIGKQTGAAEFHGTKIVRKL